ncbi:MAG: regulatory protein GemA [Rikenellaceae bacterium]|nr:regulatory protein GemA [Rikenellaceae bacterium]
MATISNQQKRQIHALVSALGWSDTFYRSFLHAFCGANSCTELTEEQASALIAELLDAQDDCSPKATAKQVSYIKYLWLSVDYDQGNYGDKHLASFLARRFNVDRPEKLTRK